MELFEKEKLDSKQYSSSDLKPLADRMRPESFDNFFGQEKIIGVGTPLRKAIENDKVTSLVFWGPPGSGKTTLAQLIAKTTQGQFISFSAVTSGIKQVKEVISKAGNYYKLSGRRTYLFIDEIHRFNKAQQDAFLPYVESGEIVLIGATTENPSFEIISALLSRMRVYVLERLDENALIKILSFAITDKVQGLGDMKLKVNEDSISFMASAADGDARRGLVVLENAALFVGEKGEISIDVLKEIHQKAIAIYDKAGEEHYNLISVLHKTIRGGDPNASLYWLARMLDGGEEPMYIIRRLVRFASEDIGLADPYALTLILNARDSYHFLGSPEGELAIAEAVVYMACAPKSNSIYMAFKKAQKDASEKGSLPVPYCLRNAPTSLMKDLGYGKNYRYAHEFEDGITDQEYFPDELKGSKYYFPKNIGREKKLSEYIEWYMKERKKKLSDK
jgi:putative ATPase